MSNEIHRIQQDQTPTHKLVRDLTGEELFRGSSLQCLQEFHKHSRYAYGNHRDFGTDTYTISHILVLPTKTA